MERAILDIVGYASMDRVRIGDGQSHETLGGAAIYAALSAARLGVSVRLFMAVGEDFPDTWLAQLKAKGIDTSPVVKRAGPSRRANLTYDTNQERLQSAQRDTAWWARTRALLPPLPNDDNGVACLLCPIPTDLIATVRNFSRNILIADTSEAFASAGPSVLPAFNGVDIFAPSLVEARMLTDESEEARVIDRLSHVVPTIILKRGKLGLIYHHDGRSTSYVGPVVPAVDPTGAGDSALGAIAASVVLGHTIQDQLAAAATAGALAVGGIGPTLLGWDG